MATSQINWDRSFSTQAQKADYLTKPLNPVKFAANQYLLLHGIIVDNSSCNNFLIVFKSKGESIYFDCIVQLWRMHWTAWMSEVILLMSTLNLLVRETWHNWVSQPFLNLTSTYLQNASLGLSQYRKNHQFSWKYLYYQKENAPNTRIFQFKKKRLVFARAYILFF